MELAIFSLLALVMGAFYLYIGYSSSRKNQTLTDFFLAGKDVGIFALSMSLIATQLGGGAILGTSQEAYTNGFSAFAYIFGICLGFILLAAGFAKKIRAQRVATIAQIFEKRYQSPLLTKAASLASVASLGGVLIAQMVGSRSLLIALHVYSPTLFSILWAIVIIYTMMGGLKAVIENNTFQLIFIILVFVSLFFVDLFWYPQATPMIDGFSKGTDLCGNSIIRFFTIALTPALYSLFEQDIAQTIIAAKNQRTVFWGTIGAAIGMISFAYIPFYFGIQAAQLPEVIAHIHNGAQPLMALITNKYGSLVQLLVTYGILAAILSTANSLLCAISSHITLDFHLSKEKNSLWMPKLVTLLVGFTAFILALSSASIIDILVLSYLIPIATIFIPIIAAYFFTTVSRTGAYITFITGSLGYIATLTGILPSWGIWATIALNTLVYSTCWLSAKKKLSAN